MRTFIYISLALFFSTSLAAQTYTVGVEKSDFMPHFGVDEQGEFSGFARDLLDMFAEYADIELIYQPMPVADLVPALVAGEIDFKYPDNPK